MAVQSREQERRDRDPGQEHLGIEGPCPANVRSVLRTTRVHLQQEWRMGSQCRPENRQRTRDAWPSYGSAAGVRIDRCARIQGSGAKRQVAAGVNRHGSTSTLARLLMVFSDRGW